MTKLEDQDARREQIYKAAVRAILLRHGGSLSVAPEEMPMDAYTIMFRLTPEGGLEFKLEDGATRQ